mmetsp:Transcript_68375/g.164103  ORF Transcript_68375/g.164103 Transcript_68375/m.164103 type:complete len:83 (-) Transcript_68375:851-1099(-)
MCVQAVRALTAPAQTADTLVRVFVNEATFWMVVEAVQTLASPSKGARIQVVVNRPPFGVLIGTISLLAGTPKSARLLGFDCP